MQAKKETIRDFLQRTDELAGKLGINLEDLPAKIGISRATLFFGRSGERPPSAKTLSKLKHAEEVANKETSKKYLNDEIETPNLMEDEKPHGAEKEPGLKEALQALNSALDLLKMIIESKGKE